MSVAKSARLPLEIIQGSVKDRYKNIQAANEKIFEQIMENPDDLSLKKLQSIAQDVFSPSNNKINVKHYVSFIKKQKGRENDIPLPFKSILS